MPHAHAQRGGHRSTEAYRFVLADVERQAWEAIAAAGIEPHSFGSCHAFWPAKQRILLEQHGISWRTPAQMNPNVLYD